MKTETLPAKAEFKFNCPNCGQHILAATEWSGLGISCPSCHNRITIPPPSNQGQLTKRIMSPNCNRQTLRTEFPLQAGQSTEAGHSHAVPFAPGSVDSQSSVQRPDPRKGIGKDPWSDLGQKLEKGVLVEPAELATALFQELISVRRRLDKLEKQMFKV